MRKNFVQLLPKWNCSTVYHITGNFQTCVYVYIHVWLQSGTQVIEWMYEKEVHHMIIISLHKVEYIWSDLTQI